MNHQFFELQTKEPEYSRHSKIIRYFDDYFRFNEDKQRSF